MLSIKKELFQYQVDRHVYVNEEEGKEKITHVQFYNEKSYRAKVVKVETDENGVRSAVIPSVLLKQPYSIMAVGCQRPEEADSQKDYIVITRKSFRVIEQPKPEDYEYLGDQQAEKVPYTTLTKQRRRKDNKGRAITIHCHNLIPGKRYKICLETRSRYRGTTFGSWRHPKDYQEGVDIKDCYGYGSWYSNHGKSVNSAILPPDWMKNEGCIQTEWLTDGKGDSYNLTIKPEIVFQNLRKPGGEFEEDEEIPWDGLVGLQNQKGSCLIFRFTVFEEEQEWYDSKNRAMNILKLGQNDQSVFGYVSII